MSRLSKRGRSRREFLKLAAGGLAAAGAGALLQGTARLAGASPLPRPRASGGTLVMWWWGEQEAPGLEGYVKQSIQMYKEKTGWSVDATLEDTGVVISQFQTASAAGTAPDIQYFWNGIYHMESVWLGYVEPLNGLIPDDLLKASNATILSVYQGKQYRLGWYAVPMLWAYNKDMFDKAGLNADQPPTNHDELMAACDKLKSKGFTPIVGGLKDGYWGEWQMGHGLGPNLDSPAEALQLFIGSLDWRNPKYYDHWAKVEQLWKAGYMNNDMLSIELYPGIDLFNNGQGAMCSTVGPLIPKSQKALGDRVAPMVFPAGGKGKMNGKPIADTQGLGISSQSQHKQQAADFLMFLNTPERLQALWDQTHALPTNAGWDGTFITDPVISALWTKWMHGDNVPYISNLMPTLFWTDAMFVNSQKIISGEFTAEQAAENAQAVAQKWRDQNPDLLDHYTKWASDLAL